MSKKNIKMNSHHWIELIPIILFITVTPLIVRFVSVKYPLGNYYWYPNTTVNNDFFSYGKSVMIIISAVLAVIIFSYKLFKNNFNLKKSKIYIPLGIYAALVILSWISSKHMYTATFGYMDRYEGSLVVLSYIFLFFYTFNILDNEKQLKTLIKFIAISALILNLIGVTQLIGHDILQVTFIKKLYTPMQYWKSIDKFKFTFYKEIYQTLYNINYVGSYLALIIPLSIFFCFKEKNTTKKILWFLFYSLLMLNLVGSKSSGGILGFGFSIIILIIIFNKNLSKYWKEATALLIITIIEITALNGVFFGELKSSLSTINVKTEEKQGLKNIYVKDGIVHINYNDYIFTVDVVPTKKGSSLNLLDENNKPLVLSFNKKYYIIKNNKLSDIKIYTKTYKKKNHAITIIIKDTKWSFAIIDNKLVYINVFGKLCDLIKADSIGFKGREKFGSSRGYIWSRSLPLLKNNLFIGDGADTFIYQFPHNDYFNKTKSGFALNEIIDKPHDMFIQTGVNTGVLSLISILILFATYFFWSFKLYFKDELNNLYNLVGISVFIGFCGFMITSFVNDSTVSTAPVFWGVLGIGFACNYIITQKNHIAK